MSFTEKIDVLDMIINILNEHEKKLDSLVTRLEEITENLAQIEELAESSDKTGHRKGDPMIAEPEA